VSRQGNGATNASRLNNQGGRKPAVSQATGSDVTNWSDVVRADTPKHTRQRSSIPEVVDLDSSIEESLRASLMDFSNNSNPADGHVCTVLNCEAVLSSEGALGQHMNLFQHSPCNPYLKAADVKLAPDALCFLCPGCDREFASIEQCNDHIKEAGHLVFLTPLEICAYMCPQCLYLFESYEKCWEHIEKSSHHNMAYPFKGKFLILHINYWYCYKVIRSTCNY